MQNPDFNSPNGFEDFCNIPEFHLLQGAFFSKQDGYEGWAALIKVPEWYTVVQNVSAESKAKLFSRDGFLCVNACHS